MLKKKKKEEKRGDTRIRDDGKQEEHVVYYCPEQEDEERWEDLEAIVDTICEATIIGDLWLGKVLPQWIWRTFK